jgi:hypothetical protein
VHCCADVVQGWDDLCITELQAAQQAAGHESVVLSTYPLGYDGQGTAAAVPEAAPTTLLCAKEFDASGLLRVQSRYACDTSACVWVCAQLHAQLEAIPALG